MLDVSFIIPYLVAKLIDFVLPGSTSNLTVSTVRPVAKSQGRAGM